MRDKKEPPSEEWGGAWQDGRVSPLPRVYRGDSSQLGWMHSPEGSALVGKPSIDDSNLCPVKHLHYIIGSKNLSIA